MLNSLFLYLPPTLKVGQKFQKANKWEMMLTMKMVVYIYTTHANHFQHILIQGFFPFY